MTLLITAVLTISIIIMLLLLGQEAGPAVVVVLCAVGGMVGVVHFHHQHSGPTQVKASYDIPEPTEGPIEFEAYSQQLLGLATQQCVELGRKKAVITPNSQVLACKYDEWSGVLKVDLQRNVHMP